jgi:signal transduction histidine kinase
MILIGNNTLNASNNNDVLKSIDSLISYTSSINSSFHVKASYLCDSILNLCKINSYAKGEAEILRIKGLSEFYNVEYSEALKYFVASKEKFEKLNYPLGIALANNNIAIVYSYLGFHEKSLELDKENLAFRERINDTAGITTTLNNLGVDLKHMKKYDDALFYYKKALEYELKHKNNKKSISLYCNNIGIVYVLIKKYDSAFVYLNKSLDLRIKNNEIQGMKNSYQALGEYYYQIGNNKLARINQEKSLKIAFDLGIVYEIESISDDLSKTYEKLGLYQLAYETSVLNRRMMDSVKLNEASQFITKLEMEKAYLVEKKISELKQEKLDLENNSKLNNEKSLKIFFIVFTILLFILSILIWISLKNKKRHNKVLLVQQEEIFQKNEEIITQHNEILSQNQELEKINSEKDKFFSIIAHDLKSPFAGFLGLSRILADDYEKLSANEIQEFGRSLTDSANNLYKLLENLLEWSRLQRGVMDFNPEACMLKFIVDQNISIQNEVAKQKNITLVNLVPDNATPLVDIPMLNTVIRNFISNSIKFSNRGGKIEIGAEIIDDPFNKSLKLVRVFVSDYGIGMSQDIIDKLFKIDEKVSRPGTENEPSTGLGLLLCSEFIEKNRGKVFVESEINQGTTISFTLPLSV